MPGSREPEAEVINLHAPSTIFDGVSATPKVPSVWRAMDQPIAAPIARPTLANESPTPTGRLAEEVVALSPVKEKKKQSTLSFIQLDQNCFQPPIYLVDRANRTDTAKRQA